MKAIDVQIDYDPAEQSVRIPNGCGLLIGEQAQMRLLYDVFGILK